MFEKEFNINRVDSCIKIPESMQEYTLFVTFNCLMRAAVLLYADCDWYLQNIKSKVQKNKLPSSDKR